MSLPQPINWLRNLSCPYLVFEMGQMGWPEERNEREQIIVSILRGNLDGETPECPLLSVINEEDRMEVMELLKNIPTFKATKASWQPHYFFDIPYYALVSSALEYGIWYCLILPTAKLGSWSKELDHDWIDMYNNTLGSLFG